LATPVAAAIGRRDIARAVAGRLLGIELDRAADRVAAGQRTLRPTQHLDPIEIEQVEDRSGQRGIIDIVDIEADARLQRRIEVILADAADAGDQRGAEGRALRLQRDRWRLVCDLCDVGLAARLQHCAGNGGDRQRRLLQILFAKLGGDDDFLDARLIGRIGIGPGAGGGVRGGRLCLALRFGRLRESGPGQRGQGGGQRDTARRYAQRNAEQHRKTSSPWVARAD
jgi:hypothetical protein